LDPGIDPTDIAVSVKNGVVTLTGFTRSYMDKYEAERAAKRVAGVLGWPTTSREEMTMTSQAAPPRRRRDAEPTDDLPATDIVEMRDAVLMLLDVPGAEADGVSVTLDKDVLTSRPARSTGRKATSWSTPSTATRLRALVLCFPSGGPGNIAQCSSTGCCGLTLPRPARGPSRSPCSGVKEIHEHPRARSWADTSGKEEELYKNGGDATLASVDLNRVFDSFWNRFDLPALGIWDETFGRSALPRSTSATGQEIEVVASCLAWTLARVSVGVPTVR